MLLFDTGAIIISRMEIKITLGLTPSFEHLIKEIIMATDIQKIDEILANTQKILTAVSAISAPVVDFTPVLTPLTAIAAQLTDLQNDLDDTLPVVTAVSPTTGAIAGNQPFTLTGTGFTGATAVTVGTVPATNVAVANDTSLTFTSPAVPAGTLDVTVTTPAGVSLTSSADQITLS